VQQAPTSLASAASSEPLSFQQKADMQIVFANGMERQGRLEEARDMYLKAMESDPTRVDAYHRLALIHDQLGEPQTAATYYQQSLELAPENPEILCDHGYSCYLQQRWQEAEASLRQAITLSPELRRAHNNLGLVLARTGRDQEALEAFARAGCDRAQANANLAHAMMLSDRWNEAEVHFQRALETDPDLSTAREGLAGLQSLLARQEPAGPKFNQPSSARQVSLATHDSPLFTTTTESRTAEPGMR
jgi:Flp pilus assembly protein TadD